MQRAHHPSSENGQPFAQLLQCQQALILTPLRSIISAAIPLAVWFRLIGFGVGVGVFVFMA